MTSVKIDGPHPAVRLPEPTWRTPIEGWSARGARCVFVLVACVLMGSGAAHADAGDAPTSVAAGRRLYLHACSGCHGQTAEGDGPDAALWSSPPADLRRSGVLTRYSDDELIGFVRDGRRLRLDVRPEALRQHAEETDALVTFVRRLPSRDWEKIDGGREIYLDRCVPCHDRYGRPQATVPAGVRHRPRDLSHPTFQTGVDDTDLVQLVRHGRNGMPALVPRVDEEDAVRLVAYVRLLSPGHTLYVRYCETCHGPHGEGAQGLVVEAGAPRFAFDQEHFRQHSPERTRRAVWHMLRDAKPAMPHFASVVSDADVVAILRYLRALPPLPAPSSGPAKPPATGAHE